jgi:hypothetical protein
LFFKYNSFICTDILTASVDVSHHALTRDNDDEGNSRSIPSSPIPLARRVSPGNIEVTVVPEPSRTGDALPSQFVMEEVQSPKSEGRTPLRSKGKSFKPSVELLDESTNNNNNNSPEKVTTSRLSRDSIEDQSKSTSPAYDREDHRMLNRRGSHVGKGGVSARLNGHIRKDNEGFKVDTISTSSLTQLDSKSSHRILKPVMSPVNKARVDAKGDEEPYQVSYFEPIVEADMKGYGKYLDSDDSDEDDDNVDESLTNRSRISREAFREAYDKKHPPPPSGPRQHEGVYAAISKTPHSSPQLGYHNRTSLTALNDNDDDGSSDDSIGNKSVILVNLLFSPSYNHVYYI